MNVVLTPQEFDVTTAALKAIIKAAPEGSTDVLLVTDVYARIEDSKVLDEVTSEYVLNICKSILKHSEDIMNKYKDTEAGLRAEVVNDIYSGIKEKIENARAE